MSEPIARRSGSVYDDPRVGVGHENSGENAKTVFASAGCAQQPKVQGEKQVWQIGEFDQTSREFGRNFEFESDEFKPVFVVGQSKTVEWPAVQVSSISGVGGKHSPPYTIQFRLAVTSKENYKLKVAVLLVNPAVPDLIVEINGHRGRYYFDRKIGYYPGDDRIDSPIYGGDELNIELPGRFFLAALRIGKRRLHATPPPTL